MKTLINVLSLLAVATVITGCCNTCCEDQCAPRCCPQPRIWENNNCCE